MSPLITGLLIVAAVILGLGLLAVVVWIWTVKMVSKMNTDARNPWTKR